MALPQSANLQEQVAALKASLAASKAMLKQYEWVETTVVSLKGEEKSSQMSRCYYGADGKVQKVSLTAPPPPVEKRGLRGRIAKSRQAEMTDYMKEAIGLLRQYLPLEENKIHAAKDAGKVSLTPLPDQRLRLTFVDYLKPGDRVALECDLTTHRPLRANIATSLSSQDPVTLQVRFAQLDNNASYPSQATLGAPVKEMTVSMHNSGYRKVSN